MHSNMMMGKKIRKMMGKSRMMRRKTIKVDQAVKERFMIVLTKISPSMTKKIQSEASAKDIKQAKGQNDDSTAFETSIISPLTCTYHRGRRNVFAASKRKRAITSQTTKKIKI